MSAFDDETFDKTTTSYANYSSNNCLSKIESFWNLKTQYKLRKEIKWICGCHHNIYKYIYNMIICIYVYTYINTYIYM